MKVFLLLVLWAVNVKAATEYRISDTELEHDSSIATFTVGPTTYGSIIGISYGVKAVDSVTGADCNAVEYVKVDPPRNSFPTANQVKAAIQADARSKGIKRYLDVCLSSINSQRFRNRTRTTQNISGVDGSTVTIVDQ